MARGTATTAADLRELTDEELVLRVREAKEELFNLRFQMATGQLDSSSRIKQVRHEMARVNTVLREREIEAELDAIAAHEEETKKVETKKVDT